MITLTFQNQIFVQSMQEENDDRPPLQIAQEIQMSAGLIQDRLPPHPEMILPEYQQYQLAEMYKLALIAAMTLVCTSRSAALCISISLSVLLWGAWAARILVYLYLGWFVLKARLQVQALEVKTYLLSINFLLCLLLGTLLFGLRKVQNSETCEELYIAVACMADVIAMIKVTKCKCDEEGRFTAIFFLSICLLTIDGSEYFLILAAGTRQFQQKNIGLMMLLLYEALLPLILVVYMGACCKAWNAREKSTEFEKQQNYYNFPLCFLWFYLQMGFISYFFPDPVTVVSSVLFLCYSTKTILFFTRFKHESLRLMCKIPDTVIRVSLARLYIPKVVASQQHFRSRQYAYLAKVKAEEERKKKYRRLTFGMFEEEQGEEQRCFMCCVRSSSVASQDCGHLIFCGECARKQRYKGCLICPVCGVRATSFVKIKIGGREKFRYSKNGYQFGGLLRNNQFFYSKKNIDEL